MSDTTSVSTDTTIQTEAAEQVSEEQKEQVQAAEQEQIDEAVKQEEKKSEEAKKEETPSSAAPGAADRSAGTMTVQLGGSSNGSFFEIVDHGWTTVTFKAGMNDFSYKGNNILHAGNYNSYSPTLTGDNASGTWRDRKSVV